MRDFAPAYDRCGSNPDLSASAPMSPSASCGHDAASALGSNVPEPAVSNRSKTRAYSITSSACSRNASDIVRFRAFAVLRLTANSNFSADWSGSSPGFAPFRILST